MTVKTSYAAVPGLNHDRTDEKSCQDYISSVKMCGGVVMCLCDGAGSAKYAREGAKAVSEAICKYLSKSFFSFANMKEEKMKKKIVQTALEAVSGKKGEIRDYNCTLLAVAIKHDRRILIHIGDGIIGYEAGNKISLLSEPENGEFKNETYFITSPDACLHISIRKGKIQANKISYFMMSDGSAESFYQKGKLISKEALKVFCESNFDVSEKEMSEYLKRNLFEVISQQTGDDCSMGIVSVENRGNKNFKKT